MRLKFLLNVIFLTTIFNRWIQSVVVLLATLTAIDLRSISTRYVWQALIDFYLSRIVLIDRTCFCVRIGCWLYRSMLAIGLTLMMISRTKKHVVVDLIHFRWRSVLRGELRFPPNAFAAQPFETDQRVTISYWKRKKKFLFFK